MATEEQDAATALQLFTEARDTATNDYEKFTRRPITSPDSNERWPIPSTGWKYAPEHANKVDEVSVSTALPASPHPHSRLLFETGQQTNRGEVHQSAATQHRDQPPIRVLSTTAPELICRWVICSLQAAAPTTRTICRWTTSFHGHGERGGLAALARGEFPGRVYIIELTSAFENDPNDRSEITNSTRSYRSPPLRITGEITEGRDSTLEALQHYRNKLNQSSGEIITWKEPGTPPW